MTKPNAKQYDALNISNGVARTIEFLEAFLDQELVTTPEQAAPLAQKQRAKTLEA